MSGVRVIVNITMESPAAVDAALEARIARCKRAESAEEGCFQYEIYRSAMRPEKLALLEHWATYELYDRHWTGQVAREGLPARRPGSSSSAEFYPHDRYEIVEGIWVPAEPERRTQTIRWAP
jgi:quinol monooxygenase YgiN